MAQASYDIQGSDGVKNTLKTAIDAYFDSVLTKNSGNSAPSVTKAFMWWADTTTGLLKRRDSTNANWLTICRLDDVGGLRTNAGNPNGAITGNYEGQPLYDTTNDVLWLYSGSSTVWFTTNQKYIETTTPTTAAGEHAIFASSAESVLKGRSESSGSTYNIDVPYLYYRDEQANTINGGGSSAGVNTRVLNTEVMDTHSIASLASNQITLPAGTYRVKGLAPCFRGNRHKLSLYNVTDSTYTIVGQSLYADNVNLVGNSGSVNGQFTIAASKAFTLRHWIETAVATNGLGAASSSGIGNEVYAEVELWKVN